MKVHAHWQCQPLRNLDLHTPAPLSLHPLAQPPHGQPSGPNLHCYLPLSRFLVCARGSVRLPRLPLLLPSIQAHGQGFLDSRIYTAGTLDTSEKCKFIFRKIFTILLLLFIDKFFSWFIGFGRKKKIANLSKNLLLFIFDKPHNLLV